MCPKFRQLKQTNKPPRCRSNGAVSFIEVYSTVIWQFFIASSAVLCASALVPAQAEAITLISVSGQNAFNNSAFEITQTSVHSPQRVISS